MIDFLLDITIYLLDDLPIHAVLKKYFVVGKKF
jgi:hypothetical protein